MVDMNKQRYKAEVDFVKALNVSNKIMHLLYKKTKNPVEAYCSIMIVLKYTEKVYGIEPNAEVSAVIDNIVTKLTEGKK